MKQLSITKFPPLEYACSEAINTLCTNISFSRENVKIIMITSCQASEGKSFLSMNIMRSMTKLGKKVALVDADMRGSVLNAKYGIKLPGGKEDKGLAHLLSGNATEEEVIYETDIEGAYMVPIGRSVPDALFLLTSARFKKLLDGLASKVDYVLVDVPPVNVVIDAAEVAKNCDGVILTVSYNRIHRRELIDAKEQIEQTGCPILGTVLNQVDYEEYLGRNYYYKSYYHNHYYSDQYYNKKGTVEKKSEKKSEDKN